ncbi:sensor histidine kinase [Ectobacillus panaciterrae]|uniref:sensor histidine kinase n=1 Tax=Ectobacillus panaciterrae TaxID=363872 RepID=UPI0004086E5E|nr:sensor histidine kinase [Ectobacillus panaciterrae]
MFSLLPLMIERVGVLVIVAFLLSRLKSFRRIVQNEHSWKEKIVLTGIFGLFGIISNYTGIEIYRGEIVNQSWLMGIEPTNAIANTRIMGVGIGGLLGGPVVGLGVGIIAGGHRYALGGFTAGACAISSVLAGLAAGWIGKKYRRNGMISPWLAVGVGMMMEALQMVIILLVTKPFDLALDLVSTIAVPMILINGLGNFIFMIIIQSILREEEKTRALQTYKALLIADQTLPHFRQGLNPQSCKAAAVVIHRLTEADAVAITDSEHVLAHVGGASDHHIPFQSPATKLTKTVLETGEIITAKKKEDINCFDANCPLHAAVVLPLKVHEKTVGTLKLYFQHANRLDKVEQELAEGLARLFSTQLELAEAEQQTKLLKDAEIKALQAQINPHFLFNAINTISVLCRTDAEKARKLLLQLSVFFRSNLQGARQMLIPIEKELEHVQAYLSLEQARFPNKYKVEFHIESGIDMVMIPPFTLQPLVENAIRHAFQKEKKQGKVHIYINSDDKYVYIRVEDNGNGIPPERLASLGTAVVSSEHGTGTALYNIRERLKGLYGKEAQFHIRSCPQGTEVSFRIVK